MALRDAVLSVAGLAGILVLPAWIQEGEKSKKEHTILASDDVKWGEAPAILPPEAKAAPLDGDPKNEGIFILRLKLPAGYKMPPHWHPVDKRVTILSGLMNLGLGDNFDVSKTRPLPAGSFYSLPPRAAHYSLAAEESVMHISTVGPWSLTYVHRRTNPGIRRNEDPNERRVS